MAEQTTLDWRTAILRTLRTEDRPIGTDVLYTKACELGVEHTMKSEMMVALSGLESDKVVQRSGGGGWNLNLTPIEQKVLAAVLSGANRIEEIEATFDRPPSHTAVMDAVRSLQRHGVID